jgi:hypothetical protein
MCVMRVQCVFVTFSKRVLTDLSNFGALTGTYRHTIAISEPVIAIHTTDTAAGTRASNDPKCNCNSIN